MGMLLNAASLGASVLGLGVSGYALLSGNRAARKRHRHLVGLVRRSTPVGGADVAEEPEA